MKILSFIFFILFIPIIVFGQSNLGKMETLFNSSNNIELVDQIEQLKKDKSSTIGNIWIQGEVKGDVIPKYHFRQYSLVLIVPVNTGSTDYWGQKEFHLEVLSNNGQIILKRLIDAKGHLTKKAYQHSSLNAFVNSYEVIYNTILEKDFDSIVLYENDDFGVACYFDGQLPLKGKEMMKLVNDNNVRELVNWVKSISPLTQAYGVLGLHILSKRGIKINREEERIVALVKKKLINISTCKGCFSGFSEPLNTLLSEKNLNSAYEYLK